LPLITIPVYGIHSEKATRTPLRENKKGEKDFFLMMLK
jgi:hypothetical protein